MFSRTAARLHGPKNPLYSLRDELTSAGCSVTDLVSGNVTEQGLGFPQPLLEEILVHASRRCRAYHPDPFGQAAARRAISGYYRDRDVALPPEHLLLTPGTSISYWYCFRLLADEGEEILCPRPTYPLFDYIAELSGVRMICYPLEESRSWAIDFDRLEHRISNATRAVILISPHNPTGHTASPEEIARLADVARRHGLAVIADEVFSEFLLSRDSLPRPAGSEAPLVFTLNGFSKMYALPGVKLGWIGVSGESALVVEAMRALELISDTFLPVSEIIQAAAPAIFQEGVPFLETYTREIRSRWLATDHCLRQFPSFSYEPPGGGFYLTLRLDGIDEERAAERVLSEHRLLVHPGYFYDMNPDHLVFSFIHPPEKTREHLPRLGATIENWGRSPISAAPTNSCPDQPSCGNR
jgi:alanine-synthesizing transaminase